MTGKNVTTADRSVTIYNDNAAWVLDYNYLDIPYWGYWWRYLGSSFEVDVDVSNVMCGCAADVHLVNLDL